MPMAKDPLLTSALFVFTERNSYIQKCPLRIYESDTAFMAPAMDAALATHVCVRVAGMDLATTPKIASAASLSCVCTAGACMIGETTEVHA